MRVVHDPEASGLRNILCSRNEGLGGGTGVLLVWSRESEYGDGDDDVVTLSLMMLSVPRVRKAKVAMCYGDEDNDAVVLRTRSL